MSETDTAFCVYHNLHWTQLLRLIWEKVFLYHKIDFMNKTKVKLLTPAKILSS